MMEPFNSLLVLSNNGFTLIPIVHAGEIRALIAVKDSMPRLDNVLSNSDSYVWTFLLEELIKDLNYSEIMGSVTVIPIGVDKNVQTLYAAIKQLSKDFLIDEPGERHSASCD